MSTETVLITGASAGIGKELARLFAADKSNLVLVARRRERLEELSAEIRERHGAEVRVLAEDLAQPETPQRIYDQLEADHVQIDVLVNNAGFGVLGPLAESDVQQQLEMIQVNVAALTHLCRLFSPGMTQRRHGGILNVGSTAGFQAGPYMAVYYASKAFVLSLSEALHDELKGHGVTVTCLCPGPTDTEFASVAKMEKSLLFRLPGMTAERVARIGYRGFRRGKLIVVAGLTNRLGAAGTRFVPRSIARGIAARLNRPTS